MDRSLIEGQEKGVAVHSGQSSASAQVHKEMSMDWTVRSRYILFFFICGPVHVHFFVLSFSSPPMVTA